jgi:predicted TPR repeat methyltransferase
LTAETQASEGYRLGATMRFVHSRGYVEAQAAAVGLSPLVITAASTRREGGVDVPGLTAAFVS